LTFSIKGI